jgi:hypothetical protein
VVVLAASIPVVACSPRATPPQVPENAGRVGVVITGWGDTKGMSVEYRKGVGPRSRAGEVTRFPFEPCTDMHRGTWPFASQVGLVPHALSYPVPLLRAAWDSMGVYRRSSDGDEYIALYDETVRLRASDIPDVPGIIRPISQSTLGASRNLLGLDPRDGTDLLPGVVQIGAPSRERGDNPLSMPNGISDIEEVALAASMTDMRFMWDDQSPRSNETEDRMNAATLATLRTLFGDRIEARFGAYVSSSGIHPLQEDVALDMVGRGFRRLLLTRETTDNNNYANDVMTRGYIDKALCRAGWRDDVEIRQVRQIGRTPEYNTMLLRTLARHVRRRPPGTEVVVIYTTYGLPFPGTSGWGPFAAVYPLATEVYHENAYFNFLSFKRYALAGLGDYRLVFNPRGRAGDLRTESYYAYALFPPQFFGAPDDPSRFRTLREQIDGAKREGRKDIVALLSHWSHTNADNLIAMRKLNGLPYNSRAEIAAGQYWSEWCEAPDAEGMVTCEAPSAVRITLSEVFDGQADDFGRTYAQVIRGGIEQFGVMPDLGVGIAARGPVSARDGGDVAATRGPLAGARLSVPADPAPGEPERFTPDDHAIALDPTRPLVGAWQDFEAFIGSQEAGVETAAIGRHGRALGPVVLVGPYRTIFNKPARVSLPLSVRGDAAPATVQPLIFNEITRDWDPVHDVAGGAEPVLDRERGLVTFDTQVTGLFAVVEPPP